MDLSKLSLSSRQAQSWFPFHSKGFINLQFLQKVGCQKPCWDQARLSSLVNKQVANMSAMVLNWAMGHGSVPCQPLFSLMASLTYQLVGQGLSVRTVRPGGEVAKCGLTAGNIWEKSTTSMWSKIEIPFHLIEPHWTWMWKLSWEAESRLFEMTSTFNTLLPIQLVLFWKVSRRGELGDPLLISLAISFSDNLFQSIVDCQCWLGESREEKLVISCAATLLILGLHIVFLPAPGIVWGSKGNIFLMAGGKWWMAAIHSVLDRIVII